jgi:hypothetical protein
MKTQQERQADRRAEKLLAVEKQVSEGSLTVRKMTDEERERYPVRPPQVKRR